MDPVDRRLRIATCGGAVLVALLMLCTGVGCSSSPLLTSYPPFKAHATLQNQTSYSQCTPNASRANASLRHLKFISRTGKLSAVESGSARTCGKPPLLYETNAAVIGAFEPLKVRIPTVPAGTTNVSVNLDGYLSAFLGATDGGVSNNCTESPYLWHYNYTLWEWNLTSGVYGSAYEYIRDYNGYWSNYTYHLSQIPSPFHLNKTTFYYAYNYSFYESECFVESYIDWSFEPWLVNVSSGGWTYYSNLSGTNAPYSHELAVEVENITEFDTYDYYEWYGPTNSSISFPVHNQSFNNSNSEIYDGGSCGTYYSFCNNSSLGTNNTQVLSRNVSFNGTSFWWTGTFYPSDQYFAYFDISFSSGAANLGFSHGLADFRLNDATAGRGISFSNISAT